LGLQWIDAEAVGDTVRAMAIPMQGQRWHRDLLVFAVLCTLWSAVLMFRVVIRDPFSSQASAFQDVFFGIKFYGLAAHITMTIQAFIYAAFGIGILLHQRWGLILALLYFAQVVISHIIFFATNFTVPSQAVHVKITAIEGPIMFVILLYLWIRSRPLLVHGLA
jgi:hypothetical protein